MNNKIAEIRKKRGIAQQDLAERLNIDRSYLNKVERGHKKPSIALLERIANALDVSIKDFF